MNGMDCTSAMYLLVIGAVALTALLSYLYFNKKIVELNQKNHDLQDAFGILQTKNGELIEKNKSLAVEMTALSQQTQEAMDEADKAHKAFSQIQLELAEAKENMYLNKETVVETETKLKDAANELHIMKYRVQALTDDLHQTKVNLEKAEREKQLIVEAYKSLQKQHIQNGQDS